VFGLNQPPPGNLVIYNKTNSTMKLYIETAPPYTPQTVWPTAFEINSGSSFTIPHSMGRSMKWQVAFFKFYNNIGGFEFHKWIPERFMCMNSNGSPQFYTWDAGTLTLKGGLGLKTYCDYTPG